VILHTGYRNADVPVLVPVLDGILSEDYDGSLLMSDEGDGFKEKGHAADGATSPEVGQDLLHLSPEMLDSGRGIDVTGCPIRLILSISCWAFAWQMPGKCSSARPGGVYGLLPILPPDLSTAECRRTGPGSVTTRGCVRPTSGTYSTAMDSVRGGRQ
jgi:hypothetical protein